MVCFDAQQATGEPVTVFVLDVKNSSENKVEFSIRICMKYNINAFISIRKSIKSYLSECMRHVCVVELRTCYFFVLFICVMSCLFKCIVVIYLFRFFL